MGGAVSSGADNDDLIDNLLEGGYIKTASVERVFRAVDRAHYFTPECQSSAYKDLAWKYGNLHISAPCIYSEVMECLELEPGLSFLNLGSGTGYLSTMVGLILGCNGVNHGVEIHSDVLDYAKARLEDFCRTNASVDEYEFCPPRFVNGNCLTLASGLRQYDRVYCGAACPENHEAYMKALMKVGGILVMPINEQLLQIHRTSEANWETKAVLPVSFATLLAAETTGTENTLKMPDSEPLSLLDLCRYAVRAILRRNVDKEHPELKRRPPRAPRKRVKKRTLRQLVVPIFGSHSDSEDGDGAPDHGRAAFFSLDDPLEDGRSCRTIVELSHLLTRPSAPTPGRMVADDEYLSDLEESERKEEEQGEMELEETGESTSDASQQKTKAKETKREKFDSGIVEDLENGKTVDSDSEDHEMDLCSDSDVYDSEDRTGCVSFLKVMDSDSETDDHVDTADNSSVPTSPPPPPAEPVPTYTTYMQEKIRMLPLPPTLLVYLNLDRDW